mmetsp:Transcript_1201/g.2507  ORF Transcript_1201/g.2507 Transcript_1201/m.2507 type:complete len:182 (+) Transcript_1201:878-1423(+)
MFLSVMIAASAAPILTVSFMIVAAALRTLLALASYSKLCAANIATTIRNRAGRSGSRSRVVPSRHFSETKLFEEASPTELRRGGVLSAELIIVQVGEWAEWIFALFWASLLAVTNWVLSLSADINVGDAAAAAKLPAVVTAIQETSAGRAFFSLSFVLLQPPACCSIVCVSFVLLLPNWKS